MQKFDRKEFLLYFKFQNWGVKLLKKDTGPPRACLVPVRLKEVTRPRRIHPRDPLCLGIG